MSSTRFLFCIFLFFPTISFSTGCIWEWMPWERKNYLDWKNSFQKDNKNKEKTMKECLETIDRMVSKEVPLIFLKARIKSPCSYWEKSKTVFPIYDAIGVRIIVKDEKACYKVLNLLSHHFLVLAQVDFIQHPKPNGYASLHLAIQFKKYPVDIQIRTPAMHAYAEGSHEWYKGKQLLKTLWKQMSLEKDPGRNKLL